MATGESKRFKVGIIVGALASSAFFLAEGATALIGAAIFDDASTAEPPKRRIRPATPSFKARHDPAILLRRNIFNSQLGDLTQVEVEVGVPDPVTGELIVEDEEEVDRCAMRLRLKGTAVVPGDFDRSLAVIVGSDQKTAVYQGAAEVEGSRIRAIHYHTVFLQSGADLCRLAMFDPVEEQKAIALPTPKKREPKKQEARKKPKFDRNAGLSEEEIAKGVEKVSETQYNVRRELLNKVLDNAGKLIGIAAVSPKMENGKSIGMQIRGVRKGTLLEKLGIKNNDVLESVNGQSLTSTDAALGAYTTLRTSDKFTLSVIRAGKPTELNYNLN